MSELGIWKTEVFQCINSFLCWSIFLNILIWIYAYSPCRN